MRGVWVREASGWLAALGVSLVVAAQVAASARAELLFRDGDSLVVAMFARSVLAGERLDWAMSSVLFLPESAVFAVLDVVLPSGLDGVLAANAVVNLLAMYGALRFAAGARREGTAPVAWSLVALAAFGMLAMTDVSASRDALDLASLLLTTTYYSATVIAVVVVIGVLRRALAADRKPLWAHVAVVVIAAVSTLTNPLFAAWATVPLTVLLVAGTLVGVRSARVRRPRMLMLAGSLAGGTVLGIVLRMPFAEWIANSGTGYVQPERWMESAAYYAGLLSARFETVPGVVGVLAVCALIAVAGIRTVRAGTAGERLVAASGWVLPLLVVVGAIALGTHAARYLQPAVFAPVLALVASPQALRVPRAATRTTAATACVALVIGAALSIPRLADAAQRPDADLDCVTSWVDESGRTGAGQFWTVRLPKAHLADPAQLVQVDHRLNGYAWLVNRTDLDVGTVSFLVEDAQTVGWELPVPAVPESVVECGRYRILDFGASRLPLGPAHS